jgi:hypothetical protein
MWLSTQATFFYFFYFEHEQQKQLLTFIGIFVSLLASEFELCWENALIRITFHSPLAGAQSALNLYFLKSPSLLATRLEAIMRGNILSFVCFV